MKTGILDDGTKVTITADNGILANITNGKQSFIVFKFRLSNIKEQNKTQSEIALKLMNYGKVF